MKYQWLKIDWEIEFDELKSLLLSNPYTENSEKGFILDQAYNKNKLSGRYINKRIIPRETTPPYGKTERYQEIIYTTYQFVIDMDIKPSLLITDPPRAGSLFTTALAILTNHRITIHHGSIDLVLVIKELKNSLNHFSLLRIESKQIPFPKGSSASIILRGKGDLLEELKELPRYDKGHLTKIEFSFMSEFGEHKASITDKAKFELPDNRVKHYLIPNIYKIISKIM